MSGISLVAYNVIPGKIFVRDPSLRGRWMITDVCVAHFPCEHCGALIGEPCFRLVDGERSYGIYTHYVRRKKQPRNLPKPKLRLQPEDYVNEDANNGHATDALCYFVSSNLGPPKRNG